MKRIIGTIVAIGLLLLSSCAAPTPAPEPTPTAAPITTVEELVGVWRRWATEHYFQFKGDGTYRTAASTEGLEDYPWVEGEFWFEGGQLFLKDTACRFELADCVGLPAGSYEVQGAVKGYLTFVAVDEPCEYRDSTFVTKPLKWYSP